ncbi:MAG: DUF1302 domain-containing protein [Nevskiaceae bacterium]|nr:MAG: DUF1302 domain-containing protein [Nevskiaceae bacterium]TBR72654.1 MAG: DUF1302 domain-containing protein [Nevskiaceae bacterium]
MRNKKGWPGAGRLAGGAVAAVAAVLWAGTAAQAGVDVSSWHLQGYYQNDTQYRMGKDQTGNTPGLSREQNTFSLSYNKGLFGGWKLGGTFRGSYNGVYDLNDTEFGRKAGGSVIFQSSAFAAGGPAPQFTSFGESPGNTEPGNPNGILAGAFPGNALHFNYNNPSAPNYNPNQGLQLIGQRWHPTHTGGVDIAVPVRPCDVDSRGCVDFGGYGDQSVSDLRFPEFNKRLDAIRELYVTRDFQLPNGQDIFLKIGRQQVVWGRTDLFRVLDVVNPVDFSRNNIYDDLQDMRYPMAMFNAVYDIGPTKWLQDSNVQFIWNAEPFRADNLGQCGQANVMLDAGCTFRGLKNLWDNGGSVSNFAGGNIATDFGPHQIGIRNVYVPDWKLSNTTFGLKFGGTSPDGSIAFSLNYLYYLSQLPSLHGNQPAVNPFTGAPPSAYTGNRLIAFDMHYPHVRLFGGSMDYQWDWAKSAVRFEGAYTSGEEFANTLSSNLYSTNNVLRTVVGIDRPTFIPFISGASTTLISAQLFYQHIFDFQRETRPFGTAGMIDWQDNVTGTLLLQGTYLNGRFHPTIIFARDFMAQANAIVPSLIYNFTNNLVVTLGANFKTAGNINRYKVTDCRACNPYPPFTAAPGQGDEDWALSGIEPLGIFRAGPFGTARREQQVFLKVRQSFGL